MVFSVDSPDWVQVHKSADGIQTELLKTELEKYDLEIILINKKDSLYPIFGAYVLYTLKRDAEKASAIINDFLNTDEATTE
ncbi:hypothetical protein LAG90_06785 [Marinilongibacter aquaticus]|uniref:hypothetical protein n=1 Tax=Marinilongibacter aquaticus TaxID=2975157 RepID=UPI0021BDACFC|nr:hypothetical protein [Marinilongibacter aquaticus]UBM60349.1 hypothetical protein LAG90_06785 [Marinilongibacter aquaticus]